jgi:large subunit ribosomal protein L17
LLAQELGTKALDKLFKEIVPKLQGRKSGFIRVTRLGQRKSDSAEMALVEFIFNENTSK